MNTFQVADELVAEFADPGSSVTTPDQVFFYALTPMNLFLICPLIFFILWLKVESTCKQEKRFKDPLLIWIFFFVIYRQQQYDEKNIRRRVYDALNVLMAMDIISKDKKEIQWKGLPRTSLNDIEELKVSTSCICISCNTWIVIMSLF